MRKRANEKPDEEILGPAKRHAFHVARETEGRRKAWRNIAEHPLTFVYERGQLARGGNRYTPQERYDAGNLYRGLCEFLVSSGRDSTDLETIGGGYSGDPITQAKAEAMRKLAAIDARLKLQDRRIVRHVCGEGWWPGDAVHEACGHRYYVNVAIPRFVEALDALIDAIAAARRKKISPALEGG
jgi:hypothetical protein